MSHQMFRAFLMSLAVPFLPLPVSAQGPMPPANPLYRSIAGPNSEPAIFDAVSFSTFELLSLSVQFQKDQDKQKVLFAPFKLSERYYEFLSETLLNFAQEGSVSTFGIAPGWTNASPSGRRAKRLLAAMTFPSEPPGPDHESAEERARRQQQYYDTVLVSAYNKFYEALANNSLQLTAGLNVQTFSLISNGATDVDEDGIVDNAYDFKGYDISGGAVFTSSQAFGFTAAYHFTKKRGSAAANQPLVAYEGFSVSAGRRVAILNPNYRASTDYLKNLFIPSIVVGLAFELQNCDTDALAQCEKGLKKKRAATPYVDFKVSPQAQFRINLPIAYVTPIGKKSERALEPTVNLSIQLAGGK